MEVNFNLDPKLIAIVAVILLALGLVFKYFEKRWRIPTVSDAEVQAKLDAIASDPDAPLPVTAEMQAKLDSMPKNTRRAWLRKYRKNLRKELKVLKEANPPPEDPGAEG